MPFDELDDNIKAFAQRSFDVKSNEALKELFEKSRWVVMRFSVSRPENIWCTGIFNDAKYGVENDEALRHLKHHLKQGNESKPNHIYLFLAYGLHVSIMRDDIAQEQSFNPLSQWQT